MSIWSSVIGGATNLIGSALNFGSAKKNREMQIQLNRENNQFNSEQAQIQRDWQEKVSDPSYLRGRFEEAGYNPYLAMSGDAARVGSGSSASAAGTPTLQAPQLDVSSIGNTMASVAQAIKISKEASYTDATQLENLNYLRAQGAKLQGDTNWLNRLGKDMKTSPELRDLSESFIRKQATGEMERIDLANQLLISEKINLDLDSQAKRVLNEYYPRQLQSELALQASQLAINQQEVLRVVADTKRIDALTSSERARLVNIMRDTALKAAQIRDTLSSSALKRIDLSKQNMTFRSYVDSVNAANNLATLASVLDKEQIRELKALYLQSIRGLTKKQQRDADWYFTNMFFGNIGTSAASAYIHSSGSASGRSR